ncbi:universal stress protein [Desulforudis sp. 1088]|uniref:universal stress protein n=1 Tax=unclassified Candidatus Desulforudis TaxID=2635950 RepID=UPI003BC68753
MINRVLAGVDGSPNSLRAVRTAADVLDRELQGTLTLVYVAKAPTALEWFQGAGGLVQGGIEEVEKREREAVEAVTREGQKMLEEARSTCLDILKDRPVRIETLVLFGDPAQLITEYAEEKKYDMIVLGSRGAGPLRGVLLGSVSYKVLNSAHCPVLIVK